MKLLIVDTKSKAAKIAPLLDTEWHIEAAGTNFGEFPKDTLAVDYSRGFECVLQTTSQQRTTLTRLKKLVASAEAVYIATNTDAEGEALAWEIAQGLAPKIDLTQVRRVCFSALTKDAVGAALSTWRGLDQNTAEAHLARQAADHLASYVASKVASRVIHPQCRVERFEAVCLRFVVDRERLRSMFRTSPMWVLDAHFSTRGVHFAARLTQAHGVHADTWKKSVAMRFATALRGTPFHVVESQRTSTPQRPPPPFVTATLIQAVSEMLSLTPDETLQTAFRLYEQGWITNPLSDVAAIPREVQDAARLLIRKEYGAAYVPVLPPVYRASDDPAQTGIRPTDLHLTGLSHLNGELRALYQLIRRRLIASQASVARFNTSVAFLAPSDKAPQELRHLKFVARERSLVFDGFLRYLNPATRSSGDETAPLPKLWKDHTLLCSSLTLNKAESQPPPRYTYASLLEELMTASVNRPGDYTHALHALVSNQYITDINGELTPTDLGVRLSDMLTGTFRRTFTPSFNIQLEAQFDAIATGKANRLTTLTDFWSELSATIPSVHEGTPKSETSRQRPSAQLTHQHVSGG